MNIRAKFYCNSPELFTKTSLAFMFLPDGYRCSCRWILRNKLPCDKTDEFFISISFHFLESTFCSVLEIVITVINLLATISSLWQIFTNISAIFLPSFMLSRHPRDGDGERQHRQQMKNSSSIKWLWKLAGLLATIKINFTLKTTEEYFQKRH